MPFVRCKSEDRPFSVPAVANTDRAAWQVRHLDAVTVGETQGALNPVRTWTRVSERSSSHVTTSLIVVSELSCATTERSPDLT